MKLFAWKDSVELDWWQKVFLDNIEEDSDYELKSKVSQLKEQIPFELLDPYQKNGLKTKEILFNPREILKQQRRFLKENGKERQMASEPEIKFVPSRAEDIDYSRYFHTLKEIPSPSGGTDIKDDHLMETEETFLDQRFTPEGVSSFLLEGKIAEDTPSSIGLNSLSEGFENRGNASNVQEGSSFMTPNSAAFSASQKGYSKDNLSIKVDTPTLNQENTNKGGFKRSNLEGVSTLPSFSAASQNSQATFQSELQAKISSLASTGSHPKPPISPRARRQPPARSAASQQILEGLQKLKKTNTGLLSSEENN